MRQVLRLELDTWDAQSRLWGQAHLTRPMWTQVEDSIRALDPASGPGLTIIMNDDGAPDNCLWIKGGNGKYLVGGTPGNGRWVQFFDPSIEWDRKTIVYTADEGLTQYEGCVVTSTELVVRIARHFVTHNVFLPEVPWHVESEPEEPPDEEVREILASLPVVRRVMISFQGGPLDGIALDSRSVDESERWEVAWLLVKTRDGQMGGRFSTRQSLRSQGSHSSEGEYEVRGRAVMAAERHLIFVYTAAPGAAPGPAM